ncbi:hypothetical protein [Methylobacter sp.]|uniref:hypothetical protein n=1 Tax=Methylobacter sp. TaxID=2051955 RepID=UPI0011FCA890|nr:hypothetical protein [Methylobacter sp.]TAK59552.1 MAG: hypothetical protein EPO18_20535 [Methylobacter sp.]
MKGLSALKALLLSAIDKVNENGSPWEKFTRPISPDPSVLFTNVRERLDTIAMSAEQELEGFVRDGFYVQLKQTDMGDACIWQGIYTAMTVYRHKVLQTDSSLATMRAAAKALSMYINRDYNIVCRGAMPASLEGDLFHIDATKADKYFRNMHPYFGEMVYREDASLDSFVGLMYGIAVVLRLSKDKESIDCFENLSNFCAEFRDAGCKLTNRDGSMTKYGDCEPKLIQAPVRILAATLPSLLCGCEQWKKIAKDYGFEFERTETHFLWMQAWFNDHLAMLSNLAFVIGTKDGDFGRSSAIKGLQVLVEKHADKGNSFLLLSTLSLGIDVSQGRIEKAIQVLAEFPVGAKPMSADADVPKVSWQGKIQAKQPVPVWTRPPQDVIWQRCPYDVKGAEDVKINRMDFLLGYYLLRSLGR